MSTLHFEYLHGVPEAYGDPVLVGGVPLQRVDLALRPEGQDRIFDAVAAAATAPARSATTAAAVGTAPRGCHVPNERLSIVATCAYVVCTVRRPSDPVNGAVVAQQLRHRHRRDSERRRGNMIKRAFNN